jgi:hypothetical protein
MKRKLPLFVMVGVAGLLVPVLAVLAQSSSSRSVACCSPAPGSASKSATTSPTDDKIIDELIAILKETKSAETFIVTAMALGTIGPEAKRALPQLIRGAERLELLEDLFNSSAEAGGREISQQVAMAILSLTGGQPMGYLSVTHATAGPPYSNGSYGTPVAPTPWNQPPPVVTPSALPPSPAGAASCPVNSNPVVPGAGSTPVYTAPPTYISPPSAPTPPPPPSVKKGSPKSNKAPAPVPSAPSPTR